MTNSKGEEASHSDRPQISLEKAAMIDLSLGLPLGGLWFSSEWPLPPAKTVDQPDTLLLRGDQLAGLREAHRSGEQRVVEAVSALGAAAAELLHCKPLSVVQKPAAPPSGTLHDYYSAGKYWWRNPATPDGLPYVRRDGEVNPECYSDAYDVSRLARFSEWTTTLAVAGYLAQRDEYLSKAADLVRTWFLDPSTRQTPHFRFAQFRPGTRKPIFQGTIEARHLVYVTDAVRILGKMGALTEGEYREITIWFSSLLDWLLESPEGRAAAAADNNIGFWHDIQCAVYADFSGRDAMVRELFTRTIPRRAAAQMAPDGSLPSELIRAKPLDYAAFTLLAMAHISRISEARNLVVWNHAEADGRAFEAAEQWLRTLSNSTELQRGVIRAAVPALTSADAPAAHKAAEQLLLDLVVEVRALQCAIHALQSASLELASLSNPAREPGAPPPHLAGQVTAALAPVLKERERVTSRVIHSLEQELKQAKKREKHLQELADELESIKSSPWWPLTRPLRALFKKKDSRPLDPKAPPRDLPAEETFVMYRILGNDLYPRHEKGQTRRNLRFILENEPPLERCEKRWIVNRICDAEEEAEILKLLTEHKQPYIHLPFSLEDYRKADLDDSIFPEPGFLLSEAFLRLEPRYQLRWELQALRPKILYAMNNNGARNTALRDGRNRARWILPWDGNCYVTPHAWAGILHAVASARDKKYFIVPMARITKNEDLLKSKFVPPAEEEPQIIFRKDASEEFNEEFPYGNRPKVELLWRLGVPGPWDSWLQNAWDLPRRGPGPEQGMFAFAGWVARLNSGKKELEQAGRESLLKRGQARSEAILATLDYLDERALRMTFDPARLLAYDRDRLNALREGSHPAHGVLAAVADRILAEGEAAGAEEVQDSLPQLFWDATILALAGFVTGREPYLSHGAQKVRSVFRGSDLERTIRGTWSGTVRSGLPGTAGLFYVLDAVRLLRSADLLGQSDNETIEDRLEGYLGWLVHSHRGMQTRYAGGLEGVLHDLNTAAVAAFLNEGNVLVKVLRRARVRLGAHFHADGSPAVARPEERVDLMQAWANLAELAMGCGDNLWGFQTFQKGSVAKALQWFVENDLKDRTSVTNVGPLLALARKRGLPIDSSMDAPGVFVEAYPSGLSQPFWML